MTKCPDMEVACFADCCDVVIERQVRVEDDAETLNRRRQRYARTTNVDTFNVLRKSSLCNAELDSFEIGWVEREAVVRQPVVQCIGTLLSCVNSNSLCWQKCKGTYRQRTDGDVRRITA